VVVVRLRLGCLEGGVVDVAFGAVGVEGVGVGLVERRALGEAMGQVRVRDEELAEGDGVGLTGGDDVIGALGGELFVGNVDAAELLLELGSEAGFAGVLAGRR